MSGARPGYIDLPEPHPPSRPDPARLSAPELWARIAAADLTVGGKPLEDYARIPGGLTASRHRILDAIEEYRRFAYLAVLRPGCVPSTPVDEIWRLHLSDTRGYDDLWQAGVLGQRLDRDASATPGQGAAYAATVALYEREFGGQPPARYWNMRSEGWQWWVLGCAVLVGAAAAWGTAQPGMLLLAAPALLLPREFRLVTLRSS